MIYIVFGDLWWNLSIPWKYATPQQSTHSTVASFSVCHKWSCMVLWCRTFTRKYSGGSNANHHLLSCVYAACHALGSSTAIVFNMSYRFLFGDSFSTLSLSLSFPRSSCLTIFRVCKRMTNWNDLDSCDCTNRVPSRFVMDAYPLVEYEFCIKQGNNQKRITFFPLFLLLLTVWLGWQRDQHENSNSNICWLPNRMVNGFSIEWM